MEKRKRKVLCRKAVFIIISKINFERRGYNNKKISKNKRFCHSAIHVEKIIFRMNYHKVTVIIFT